MSARVINELLELSHIAAEIAYTPYSNEPTGCVLLLADARWIPGVRVENASFPLTIPAVQSAACTALARGFGHVVTVAKSSAITDGEYAYIESALGKGWRYESNRVLVRENAEVPTAVGDQVDVRLQSSDGPSLAQLAEQAATFAVIPESDFPVGCALEASDGTRIYGCNIEIDDWTKGLCAERVAISTARAYGFSELTTLALHCSKDTQATPCGACRQVLFEFAPELKIMMYRGDANHEFTTPEALLPGGFRGDGLRTSK